MRSFAYVLSLSILVAAFSLSCTDEESDPGTNVIIPFEDFPKHTWVAYEPTKCNPNQGQYPSADDIKQDLKTLKAAGFTGIVTYSSEDPYKDIPRWSHEAGFDACIMGVYYFNETTVQQEIPNAIAAKDYVDGYCVGNEGLHFPSYTEAQLKGVMDQIRNATGRPITTSEPGGDYLDGSERANWLVANSHWLYPNTYPVYDNIFDPNRGVTWMLDQYNKTKNVANGKPVIFKETGWPTGGDPAATWATQENQKTYFTKLAQTEVNFTYFEAFDQFWKYGEPYNYGLHWGLYDQNRNPKLFIQGGLVL